MQPSGANELSESLQQKALRSREAVSEGIPGSQPSLGQPELLPLAPRAQPAITDITQGAGWVTGMSPSLRRLEPHPFPGAAFPSSLEQPSSQHELRASTAPHSWPQSTLNPTEPTQIISSLMSKKPESVFARHSFPQQCSV